MGANAMDLARGRWRDILSLLGVDSKLLNGKQGPCPMCGGETRFRFDDKNSNGDWICNQCGTGNGYELLKRFHGWEFREAIDHVKDVLGESEVREPIKRQITDDKKRELLRALYRQSVPIEGTLAQQYLKGRGITLPALQMDEWPHSLRFVERCYYKAANMTEESRELPAMIAVISAPDGSPVNLHRTWLDPNGDGKARVAVPRRCMPGDIPNGSAIRLGEPKDGCVIGIAEGIESALSARIVKRIPTWAAYSEGNLTKFEPPDEIDELYIFGENDENYVGQHAAFGLARRISVDTKRRVAVFVDIPNKIGFDFNNVLLERRD